MTARRWTTLLFVILLIALGWGLGGLWSDAPGPESPVALPTDPPPIVDVPDERAIARLPSGARDVPPDVECEVLGKVRYRSSILELDPDSDAQLGWIVAEAESTWIRFTPRRAIGLGWLYTQEHEPVALAWAHGACLQLVELTPYATAVVRGTVEGALDQPWIAVDCGRGLATSMEPDGSFAIDVPVPDEGATCTVSALEVVDTLDRPSNRVTVELLPGRTVDVALDLPPLSDAGWALWEPAEGDVRVYGVGMGTPAAQAGLQRGDRILSVGGQEVSVLDLDAMVAVPLPTTVTVERDDEVEVIDLVP